MPFFRNGSRFLYFSHVPKCGGSSVEHYLEARFGNMGFCDRKFSQVPDAQHWVATPPQHVDWASLERLFPADFFDTVFAVVRHPVSRIVSCYHFQVEMEKRVSPDTSFSDWLRDQARAFAADPFIIDNHFRPQADFIPSREGACQIFHLEHGLEAVIPFVDAFAGDTAGPRFIGHENRRNGRNGKEGPARVPVTPGPEDLELISGIYAADFERFGYRIGEKMPLAEPPQLDPDLLGRAAADRARMNRPLNRLAARLRRALGA